MVMYSWIQQLKHQLVLKHADAAASSMWPSLMSVPGGVEVHVIPFHKHKLYFQSQRCNWYCTQHTHTHTLTNSFIWETSIHPMPNHAIQIRLKFSS